MKLDSDLTTHTISRPMDISLECNPAMETKNTSATFSHRNNANKINYYRLDINIGKLKFKDHEMGKIKLLRQHFRHNSHCHLKYIKNIGLQLKSVQVMVYLLIFATNEKIVKVTTTVVTGHHSKGRCYGSHAFRSWAGRGLS